MYLYICVSACCEGKPQPTYNDPPATTGAHCTPTMDPHLDADALARFYQLPRTTIDEATAL